MACPAPDARASHEQPAQIACGAQLEVSLSTFFRLSGGSSLCRLRSRFSTITQRQYRHAAGPDGCFRRPDASRDESRWSMRGLCQVYSKSFSPTSRVLRFDQMMTRRHCQANCCGRDHSTAGE